MVVSDGRVYWTWTYIPSLLFQLSNENIYGEGMTDHYPSSAPQVQRGEWLFKKKKELCQLIYGRGDVCFWQNCRVWFVQFEVSQGKCTAHCVCMSCKICFVFAHRYTLSPMGIHSTCSNVFSLLLDPFPWRVPLCSGSGKLMQTVSLPFGLFK